MDCNPGADVSVIPESNAKAMFKNYFKTAFRNFRKDKFYTFLNITGLAIGLATCLLIMLYVHDELGYDSYNINADNIYRVNNEIKFGGNYFDIAQTAPLLGPEAVRAFPEVKQYTRLRWYGGFSVKKGNVNIRETRVGYADSTLFEVFSLPMISGNAATALKEPHSLVITETIARKYFNRTDVAGQNMIINDTSNYRITGVIRDIPQNSHFKFDFFIPLCENPDSRSDNWLSENYNTYLLLAKNTDPVQFNKKLEEMQTRFTEPELKSILNMDMPAFTKQGGFIKCSLTPLLSIHLHSNKQGEMEGNGSIQYVYIFSAIALFILIIACVNFMNLFTARSSNRAKEVGVRKVLGSLRKNLIAQFLTESLLISLIALVIAILIAWLALPLFNQLAGKQIHFSYLLRPAVLAVLLPGALAVGFLAGVYPAFILSAFQPIDVLKGSIAKGFKGSRMRNILVVFQFAISIVLIVGTLVIYSQLSYIRNKDLGFNRQQVLVIKNTRVLKDQAKVFKEELQKISGVAGVTMTGYLPVKGYNNNDAYFTSPAMDARTAISLQTWYVDRDYIPTFAMHLINGRNFSEQFPTDSTAVILNEAAGLFLGANGQLNKNLYSIDDVKTKKLKQYHIIGIIKNFNFSSLRDVITPLALFMGKETGSIALRMERANVPVVLAQIKSKWGSMAPGQSFEYTFMDEEFNSLYDTEQRTGEIFISFAVLAIVIACLGLFGLAAYAAEQRVREIGIRKVLGASAENIVRMLSTDFLKLVIIAAVIAFPLAWWVMHKWLQDFAYRVTISWWIFALAGSGALLIALITVCYQAIKAAIANPVNSLRTQ